MSLDGGSSRRDAMRMAESWADTYTRRAAFRIQIGRKMSVGVPFSGQPHLETLTPSITSFALSNIQSRPTSWSSRGSLNVGNAHRGRRSHRQRPQTKDNRARRPTALSRDIQRLHESSTRRARISSTSISLCIHRLRGRRSFLAFPSISRVLVEG